VKGVMHEIACLGYDKRPVTLHHHMEVVSCKSPPEDSSFILDYDRCEIHRCLSTFPGHISQVACTGNILAEGSKRMSPCDPTVGSLEFPHIIYIYIVCVNL